MVTMKDVALAAKVAQSTVSFVLNDRYVPGVNIPEETRQRVKLAAKKCGYRRNEMAVAMITGKTKILGFLCSEGIRYEFISRTLEGAIVAAQGWDYLVKFFPKQNDDEKTIDSVLGQRPAGVIAWSPTKEFLELLRSRTARYRIPVVLVGSYEDCPSVCGVSSNDFEGGKMAVEHLIRYGHRHILYLTNGLEYPYAAHRLSGFQAGLREANLPFDMDGVFDFGGRRELTARDERELIENLAPLFQGSTKPTAICCSTDFLAMRAIRVLSQMGLRVPEDVSVIGYADLTMASMANPALTTIAQPFEAIGKRAVELLLGMIHKEIPSGTFNVLDVTLVERDSVRDLRV